MNSGDSGINRWKPGVSRGTLLLIAGMMWIGVGVMLDSFSYSWLKLETQPHVYFAVIVGFVCALVIHHFGFLRIVDKNLARILPMKGKRCVFSFMAWKSYILIAVMVMTGIFLRHSSIPKFYLSILYIGIGTALILSSVRYLRYLMKAWRNDT